MAQFNKLSTLQIQNVVFHLTDPQTIQWERDEESISFHATLTVEEIVVIDEKSEDEPDPV